ncbi:hypothetical protein [Nonomuraea sp. SBT364]|uniref:hypothetical protein n=1 Tax=Nonomuraea sp. SBT364 TaxID=1580530 RepID=UPI00066B60F2|nr:hypothetical protein [Nonomuraea sp. SBT364]
MTVLTAGRWLHDAWLMAGRNTRRILRAPRLLLMYALIQPVTFILLFAYVFSGAIATPGGTTCSSSSRRSSCR